MSTKTKLNTIALITIVKKEIIRIIRIWPQTLLPSAITSALYFIIFGNFLGDRLGSIHEIKYISYLAPGFIMMAIISNSYGNIASSFFSEKFWNSYQELIWSPISIHTIMLGYLMGGVIRGLSTGMIVTSIALLFTHIHIAHPIITLIAAITASIIFSLIGLINAIYAKSFDSITTIPNFVLTPLIYLGGVFYSIEILPTPWHEISLLNPILYIINSFRYGMLNISDVAITPALEASIISAVILYIFCYRLIKIGKGIKE